MKSDEAIKTIRDTHCFPSDSMDYLWDRANMVGEVNTLNMLEYVTRLEVALAALDSLDVEPSEYSSAESLSGDALKELLRCSSELQNYVMRQGAEIVRLSAPQGTYACPVCGIDQPHAHDDNDIAQYLNAQICRFGRGDRLVIVNYNNRTDAHRRLLDLIRKASDGSDDFGYARDTGWQSQVITEVLESVKGRPPALDSLAVEPSEDDYLTTRETVRIIGQIYGDRKINPWLVYDPEQEATELLLVANKARDERTRRECADIMERNMLDNYHQWAITRDVIESNRLALVGKVKE
jgi:hypothetical protein